jgi:hypothetical protein
VYVVFTKFLFLVRRIISLYVCSIITIIIKTIFSNHIVTMVLVPIVPLYLEDMWVFGYCRLYLAKQRDSSYEQYCPAALTSSTVPHIVVLFTVTRDGIPK